MRSIIRFFLMFLGVLFSIIGVLGLFLPILQGILFLIPGIYLLSITSKRFKALLERALSRFPRAKKFYESHVEKFESFWRKEIGQI